MLLHDILNIKKSDTVAIIGGGGKTTMLWKLASERKKEGAFVTTSTHIMKPNKNQCDIILSPENLDFKPIIKNKITCALYPNKDNKCTGLKKELFESLNIPILYEADGSKQMPVKFHNKTEPVIYNNTDIIILVLGLSALGKPIKDVCHRYELYNLNPNEIFNISHLIMCIDDGIKNLPPNKIRIFLNQLDVVSNPDIIHKLCKTNTYTGSLK